MKYLIALVLLLSTHNVFADNKRLRLDLNIGSYHTDRCYAGCTKEYNEFNPGIGLAYEMTRNANLVGGYLINSFDADSFYLGVNTKLNYQLLNVRIEPGVFFGAVTGYDKISELSSSGDNVRPVAMFNTSFTSPYGFQLNLGFLPGGIASKSGVVTFRVGYYIK